MGIYHNHAPVEAAPYIGEPKGYQQILAAALSSGSGLTVPDGATYALIQVEGTPGTDSVRWRGDGTKPTATVGTLIQAQTTGGRSPPPWMFYCDLSQLNFITAAGNPILNVNYYR